MENQEKPLLIRPSMASKKSPKNNFCSKSLPTLGTSTWFFIGPQLLQDLPFNYPSATPSTQDLEP